MSLSGMEDDSGVESAIMADPLFLHAPATGRFAPASPREGCHYGSCQLVPPPPARAGSFHLLIGLLIWRRASPLLLGAILPPTAIGMTLSRQLPARNSPWILVSW
jgi:hypothetical protein